MKMYRGGAGGKRASYDQGRNWGLSLRSVDLSIQ